MAKEFKNSINIDTLIKYNGVIVRPGKKNFGSGQLIFENWSGGPVEGFFLEPQPIFSKSYFSTSHKTRDPDSTCIDLSVMGKSRLKCTQDEPEGLKCSCQHTDSMIDK